MNELTKTKKHRERMRLLMEEHGWKLNVPPVALEDEDRAALGGGLRCFKMVRDRDENNKKLESVHRCGNPASKSSFFCKKHGGANKHAMIHGKRSAIASAYAGAFDSKVGSLFDAFLNDPSIMDAKIVLTSLQVCLRQYIEKVSDPSKYVRSPVKLNKVIRRILKDKIMSELEKFVQIKNICSTQVSLTDGDVLDRVTKVSETITKMIDKINNIQMNDHFSLTPDGLKLLLRAIIEILKSKLNERQLAEVKEELLLAQANTESDFNKPQNANYQLVERRNA